MSKTLYEKIRRAPAALEGDDGQTTLLTVRLDAADRVSPRSKLQTKSGAALRIELAKKTVTGLNGATYSSRIDAIRRHCWPDGLDDSGQILRHDPMITAFACAYRRRLE